MENFIFSLNATAPIFLVMILGNILMKTGFLSEEFTRVSDKFVFKVALPALLFYDISTADMSDVFNLKFILFCMFTTIIMFLVIWILTWIFMKDKSMVGAFVQASARGSAAILGMAFVQNIYGDSGMAPLMIVSAVPFYNIFSVVILTFHSRDQIGLDKKAQIRRACINVAKNPIILGILAGLLFNVLHLTMPTIPMKAIAYMSNTATPLALLNVGASFHLSDAIRKFRPAMVASTIKLVILPAVFFPAALYLGFRQSELVAILIIYFILVGIVYGLKAGTIKSSSDVPTIMAKSLEGTTGYIVLVFVIAQFINMFNYTNLGMIIAVKSAGALQAAGFTGIPLMIFFILLCCVVNLFMTSGTAKWYIFAPILVPMMMMLGYSPEFAQVVYRIGDSTTNAITPIYPYIPIAIAMAKKYDKNFGMGSLISMMLPYSVAFLLGWIVQLVIWVTLNLPIGPGAYVFM